MKNISTPLKEVELRCLRVKDMVFLSGSLLTGRDQAHMRLVSCLKKKKKLPFDLNGQVIYYCGPTATPKGKVIGSCGPTTSLRMDEFSPFLLRFGLLGMIGKGKRSPEVIKAIKAFQAVYFITYAGCGAYLSQFVQGKSLLAYPELGPEAIYRLEVKDFPLIVAVDSQGRSIYD